MPLCTEERNDAVEGEGCVHGHQAQEVGAVCDQSTLTTAATKGQLTCPSALASPLIARLPAEAGKEFL